MDKEAAKPAQLIGIQVESTLSASDGASLSAFEQQDIEQATQYATAGRTDGIMKEFVDGQDPTAKIQTHAVYV